MAVVVLLVQSVLPAPAQNNFWLPTTGPIGGRVSSLAINRFTQHIIAGTRGTGVFFSEDNGQNWLAVNNGMTNLNVTGLVINARGYLFAATFSGVFRSMDNGVNWALSNSGLTNLAVHTLAVNATGILFAGTAGGVFRSTNNGEIWHEINDGLTAADVRCFTVNAAGQIFAGTFGGGIFRSDDQGGHWREASFGLMNKEDVYALVMTPNGDIFAGTRGHGIFRSIDNGETWRAVNNGLSNLYVRSLTASTSGEIFAGTDGDGVFRSATRGDGWISIASGLTNLYVWSLAVNKSGFVFAGTDGEGVFLSATSTTSVAGNAGTVPVDLFLRQNQPNPFKTQTMIALDIARHARKLKVVIFNIEGREVVSLFNGAAPVGQMKLAWDGKDAGGHSVSAGIYFCSARSGSQTQTRKLLFLE